MAVTNTQFGLAVGCSESMASRLRTGQRLPSAALRDRITRVYKLDPNEVIAAYGRGGVEFGRFLRDEVFAPDKIEQPAG